MADEKFIEENKEVIIEEMAESISKLNTIIDSVLQAPISEELDGALMRTYFMATAMQIGSLTTLFNQYYVLLKGAFPKKKRPTGFAALIKSAGVSVAGRVLREEESPLPEDEQDNNGDK